MKEMASCPTCGYPQTVEHIGETRTCPMCKSPMISEISGVNIPTPLLVGTIAFFMGVLLGPPLIASTEAGQRWLTEQARRIK